MNTLNLYDILYKWNHWGGQKREESFPRKIADKIKSFINEPEIITIIGPRRAGKTTIMFQIMQYLEEQGVDPKAILHLNFEEPALSPELKLPLLDSIYETYRNHVFPKGKAYLFFDEIQNVPEWERWVRTKNDTDDVKIFITGSSAQLMSRELATLLTGRHITFEVLPLDFSEVLQFRKITLPNQPYPSKAPPEIQHVLLDYLRWGGFPRIVLTNDETVRHQLLKRYFEDILYKDIIIRHHIRDVKTLRSLAVYLLTQTASLISYKRLCDLFSVSHDLVENYCRYLQESFIIDLLPFYTFKTGERVRKPIKVYAIDLGLRRIASFDEDNYGKQIETLVFRHLFTQEQDGLFYWQNKGEIDLIARKGMEITSLIQITHSGLDNPKTFKREIAALIEAGEHFPRAKKYIITLDLPQHYPAEKPQDIHIIPLWQYLLDPASERIKHPPE